MKAQNLNTKDENVVGISSHDEYRDDAESIPLDPEFAHILPGFWMRLHCALTIAVYSIGMPGEEFVKQSNEGWNSDEFGGGETVPQALWILFRWVFSSRQTNRERVRRRLRERYAREQNKGDATVLPFNR
ncbi:hypothetical protein KJ766_00345 [Patescibacteria group bacterium]|nr:hypothetical protein [Patescibacteria group bacterium]